MFANRRTRYLLAIKMADFFAGYLAFTLAALYTNTFADVRTIAHDRQFSFFVLAIGSSLLLIYVIHSLFYDTFYARKEYFYIPQQKTQLSNSRVAFLTDAALFSLIDIVFPIEVFSISFILLYLVLAFLFDPILKFTILFIFRFIYTSKKNIRNVLIVGTNRRAAEFANFLDIKKFLGFNVIGFADNEIIDVAPEKVLGTVDDIPRIITTNVVDAIVIHLPIRSFYDKISEIITFAEGQGIMIHYLANFFEPQKSNIKSFQLGSISTIVLHTAPLEDWKMFVKRLVDIVLSAGALAVASPIIALAAVGIKLTSPGPVFYAQERVGYNKRRFHMYKLRTMVQAAETMQDQLESLNEMDGPVFKIKKDPRITKVGAFLRKYSIDELPQLYNVLKGDMSIVGPRPLPLRDYNRITEDWLRRRFSMRPGLTCLWQVSGRNSTTFADWIQLDMKYIDNWSLLQDFYIMLKTVPVVLLGSGE